MDYVNFAQNLELENILLLVLYLGVLCQVIYSLFGGCASACNAKVQPTETFETNRTATTTSGSNKRKKHI
jgi:hypothetical protein